MKASKFDRGFTLIEMMIVVAVLGILAAIAGPSYIDYLRRGAIPPGLAALSDGKVKMEQFFMDNRTYNNGVTGTGAVDACNSGSITGLAPENFTITCASTANTFTLTATGNSGTRVAGFIYTINQAGTKTTKDIPNNVWPKARLKTTEGGGTSTCWILKRDGSC